MTTIAVTPATAASTSTITTTTAAPAVSTRRIDLALAVLRVVVGIIFLAHGGQKLFVYGFAGVSGAFAQMGVPAPGVMGPFVALVEFFAGAALVVGLLTRLASLGLISTMVGAILLVHLKNGFFAPTGFEYPLALLAAAASLAIAGPGAFSADSIIARRTAER